MFLVGIIVAALAVTSKASGTKPAAPAMHKMVMMGKGSDMASKGMEMASSKGKGSMMSKGMGSTMSSSKGKGGAMMRKCILWMVDGRALCLIVFSRMSHVNNSILIPGCFAIQLSSPAAAKGKGSMMKMMMMMGKGKGMGDSLVTQVDLGNIRPEGITAGPGSLMYTSEIAYGGIKSVDVVTGEVKQVVESFGPFQRASLGLWYEDGVIFAAGTGEIFGVTPSVHAYDAYTGQEIVSCHAETAMFVNDLIVYKGYLYATDSMTNHILVFDVDTLMQGKCDYDTIPLPDVFADGEFYTLSLHDALPI